MSQALKGVANASKTVIDIKLEKERQSKRQNLQLKQFGSSIANDEVATALQTFYEENADNPELNDFYNPAVLSDPDRLNETIDAVVSTASEEYLGHLKEQEIPDSEYSAIREGFEQQLRRNLIPNVINVSQRALRDTEKQTVELLSLEYRDAIFAGEGVNDVRNELIQSFVDAGTNRKLAVRKADNLQQAYTQEAQQKEVYSVLDNLLDAGISSQEDLDSARESIRSIGGRTGYIASQQLDALESKVENDRKGELVSESVQELYSIQDIETLDNYAKTLQEQLGSEDTTPLEQDSLIASLRFVRQRQSELEAEGLSSQRANKKAREEAIALQKQELRGLPPEELDARIAKLDESLTSGELDATAFGTKEELYNYSQSLLGQRIANQSNKIRDRFAKAIREGASGADLDAIKNDAISFLDGLPEGTEQHAYGLLNKIENLDTRQRLGNDTVQTATESVFNALRGGVLSPSQAAIQLSQAWTSPKGADNMKDLASSIKGTIDSASSSVDLAVVASALTGMNTTRGRSAIVNQILDDYRAGGKDGRAFAGALSYVLYSPEAQTVLSRIGVNTAELQAKPELNAAIGKVGDVERIGNMLLAARRGDTISELFAGLEDDEQRDRFKDVQDGYTDTLKAVSNMYRTSRVEKRIPFGPSFSFRGTRVNMGSDRAILEGMFEAQYRLAFEQTGNHKEALKLAKDNAAQVFVENTTPIAFRDGYALATDEVFVTFDPATAATAGVQDEVFGPRWDARFGRRPSGSPVFGIEKQSIQASLWRERDLAKQNGDKVRARLLEESDWDNWLYDRQSTSQMHLRTNESEFGTNHNAYRFVLRNGGSAITMPIYADNRLKEIAESSSRHWAWSAFDAWKQDEGIEGIPSDMTLDDAIEKFGKDVKAAGGISNWFGNAGIDPQKDFNLLPPDTGDTRRRGPAGIYGTYSK